VVHMEYDIGRGSTAFRALKRCGQSEEYSFLSGYRPTRRRNDLTPYTGQKAPDIVKRPLPSCPMIHEVSESTQLVIASQYLGKVRSVRQLQHKTFSEDPFNYFGERLPIDAQTLQEHGNALLTHRFWRHVAIALYLARPYVHGTWRLPGLTPPG
jgi:hypothetical protein